MSVGASLKKKEFSVKRTLTGLGLFSNVEFKKGDHVIDYTGDLLSTKQAEERNSLYLFEINSRWTIDGAGRNNLSRYINHSCRPNCDPEIKGKRIAIHAIKKIRPGDELTYDYGEEYFDEYIKPAGCRCAYCRSKKRKTNSFQYLRVWR